jgi:signal transduction histidine kinase
MFEKSAARLTGLYLGIIMVISLFFSANLYTILVQEINRDFRRQGTAIERLPGDLLPTDLRSQLLNASSDVIDEAKAHVLGRLMLTNLIIFVGGGFVSYYLARKTLEPIEESHHALERFTADASHELRTPIAAMQTEIEVALMNPKLTLAQAKDQLKSNLEELARLTTLSEGLLKLASLEHQTMSKSQTSLQAIVEEATKRNKTLAAAKKIKLVTTVSEDVQAIVDRGAVTEALTILIDNAIKYSPEKSEVTTSLQKENKAAVINVIDNGVGIKDEDQQHIFERFYRADAARNKQKAEGYGLGLAIAKNMVELNEGSISLKSKPNKGSTFIIKLPL